MLNHKYYCGKNACFIENQIYFHHCEFLNKLILCWRWWNIQYIRKISRGIFFNFLLLKKTQKKHFIKKNSVEIIKKFFSQFGQQDFFHWNERNVFSFRPFSVISIFSLYLYIILLCRKCAVYDNSIEENPIISYYPNQSRSSGRRGEVKY